MTEIEVYLKVWFNGYYDRYEAVGMSVVEQVQKIKHEYDQRCRSVGTSRVLN
mgnify:CR=1 FL=1